MGMAAGRSKEPHPSSPSRGRCADLTKLDGQVSIIEMTRVNLAEAKARLSELVDAALDGEEIVIARRNVPVVKLMALKQRKKNVPDFGLFKGRIWIAPDFDEPLEEFAEYVPRASKPRARRKR
jgi:prevent-host-death family protein